MAPPPGSRTKTSKPSARSQPQEEQEEEITDLVAFQASLDDSVSAVRTLVDSWLPKDLDASWDAPETNSFASASLASRARPARLGLGASVTALHLQQAEENKLRQRLLSNGKGNKRGAEEEEQGGRGSTANGASNEPGSDDEEEDSRSKAFKPKANGVALSNGIGGSKANGASTSLSTPKKATSSKPPSNPFTPSQPSPSTSALPTAIPPHVKVKNAPISSSAASTAASSSTGPAAPLSKNKRKKERERERAEASKRQKLEEVLAEERAETAANETEDVVMQSPQVAKHRTVKPPFAPSPSSGGDSPVAEVQEQEKDAEDGDDSDREAESVDGSEAVRNGAGNGEGLKKKKKKRRKKKGSKAGKEGGAPKPVLNLGPSQP